MPATIRDVMFIIGRGKPNLTKIFMTIVRPGLDGIRRLI